MKKDKIIKIIRQWEERNQGELDRVKIYYRERANTVEFYLDCKLDATYYPKCEKWRYGSCVEYGNVMEFLNWLEEKWKL